MVKKIALSCLSKFAIAFEWQPFEIHVLVGYNECAQRMPNALSAKHCKSENMSSCIHCRVLIILASMPKEHSLCNTILMCYVAIPVRKYANIIIKVIQERKITHQFLY